MSIGGLIAAALGGAAEGYGKGAEMEMKKQSELDLKKQLADAEMDRQLRVDEIKRSRDIAQIKSTAEAEAEAAPIRAKGEAAAAPIKTKAEIEATNTLANDAGYVTSTSKLAEAKGAAGIKAAQIRADSIRDRPTGGAGGTKAARVQKTITGENGNVMAVMSDGTTKDLGIKSGDYNKQISNLVTKMAKDDYKFAKLPEADKRKQAEERLRGTLTGTSSGRDLSKLSAYERDATAD